MAVVLAVTTTASAWIWLSPSAALAMAAATAGIAAGISSQKIAWHLMLPLLRFRSVSPMTSSPTVIVVLAGDLARLPTFAAVASKWPNATLVFSGGAGPCVRGKPHLADLSRATIEGLGIASRVIYERSSRNTRENAFQTAHLIRSLDTTHVALVTSAWHMPRAIGSFRQVGIQPQPVCVDDRFAAQAQSAKEARHQASRAVREWLALLGYRLAGWTSEFLPTPKGSHRDQ